MKDESEKLYNTPFIIGALFTVILFEICNFISYFVALNEYNERLEHWNQEGITGSFLVYMGNWGFPFYWTKEYLPEPMVGSGVIFNLIFLAVCGYIVGLLFRFEWAKNKSQKLN